MTGKVQGSRRIIWIAFGPIGEALMMLALFDEMLASAPDTTFTVVTLRGGKIICDLSAEYPSVTVCELPKKNPLKLIWIILRLLTKPSLVIAPDVGNARSLPMEILIRVLSARSGNRTLAFAKPSAGSYTNAVEFDYYGRLYIDNLRALAALTGCGAHSGAPHALLPSNPPEDAPEPGSYIHVHMFASSLGRSLPGHRWNSLFSAIAARHPEYAIIATATADSEIAQARKYIAGTRVRLITRLSMSEMVWLVGHARLYIGVDTGITHMAGMLQKGSVVIGNRSNPVWLPTYNPNAHILANEAHCTCDGKKGGNCSVEEDGVTYYRCLYEIPDEDILAAVDAGLSRAANRA